MTRADLDKDPADVAAMFDDVAKRYDITNDVLSLGQDRRWRTLVLEAVDPKPGERVLDLAAGTGTSSQPFADARRDRGPVRLLAGDAPGRQEGASRALPFVAGDGTRLPFADDTFDAVTISFGLRNIVDPEAGLREMLRVTKPGGRLVVCEFSRPTLGAVPHGLHRVPHEGAAPRSPAPSPRNPDAYVYLAESIRAWPDQAALARERSGGRLGTGRAGATSPAASSPCTDADHLPGERRAASPRGACWAPDRGCAGL